MKKNLLAVAAVAALVACSGKTGLEKELVGSYSQSTQGKWEVRADSLFITDSTQTVQGFGVAKTADGFKLTSEQMNLVLTPKAE